MGELARVVGYPKGRPRGKGSKKGGRGLGTRNSTTTTLKDMILKALDMAGGEKYLMQQARDNPGPFLTLVGKVLPLTVSGVTGGAPIVIQLSQQELDV